MQKTTTLNRLRWLFLNLLPVLVFLVFSASNANAQYLNGSLGTGTVTKSGVAAPAGTQWHEMQNDVGNNAETNVSIAFDNSPIIGSSRVADDFTIPTGQIWTISKFTFYAVVLPPPPGVSPITAVRVVIRDASPVGASNVVFGDLVTNRLSATSNANVITIANTQVPPPGTPPTGNFVVWKVEATVNTVLTGGTYWVEWQVVGGAGQRVFALMSQPVGARTLPGYNSVSTFNNGPWGALLDAGNPASAPDVPVEQIFRIDYVLSGGCFTPTIPTVTGTNTICAGSSTTLTATGSLNSATNWFWYSGSCGGTPVGTGTSITVSPAATTTYYVRGEGPCFTPGACASRTVTVTPSATASVLSQVQLPGPPVQLFNESFDGAIPPAGWPVQNLSAPLGLTGWAQTNSLVFPPHSGVGQASANFNNTSGVGTISNWMFSPVVALKNGDVFSFWTRTTTGTFPDRLQVRLSTNGASVNVGASATSTGDFSTLLLDMNPTYTATGYPTSYTQYTLTISGMTPGATGRIAFRYFVEGGGPAGANSDFIGIDDAIYTTPTFINPTTCTGSTANLKVDITGGVPNDTYSVTINAVPATVGYPRTITGYVSGDYIAVTPAVTTTYNLVSVISSLGCVGTGNSGTPTVTVSPVVVSGISITANPTGTLCAGNNTLLTVALGGSTTPSVLYTQGTTPGVNGSPSQNFETAFDPFDCQSADDFNVPAGPGWSITRVTAGGTFSVGGPIASVNVIFYTNAGTIPSAVQIATFNNVATFTAVGGNLDITLPSPAVLPGGATYWVSVQVNMNFTPAGQWFWSNYAGAVVGSEYAWRNPGAGFGTPCTNWGAGGTGCNVGGGAANRNNIFSIIGTVSGGGGVPVGWTFLWSPAAGLSSTTGNPVAAAPSTTRTYTVVGTAPGGCQTSAAITINVNQLPAVVNQPTDVVACAGSNVTYSVTGTGAGVTYQWQLSTTGVGGPYNNIPVGAPYGGTTTNTLTITGVTLAMNNYRYRCAISGTCPPTAFSTGALLTVNALPNITVTPATPACGGLPGVIGTPLTASGNSTSYVWTPNGTGSGLFINPNATGVYTGTNLATVYAAPDGINTIYTVTGTSSGTGCSNTATVGVVFTPPPPTVTPSSVAMCLGDPPVKLKSSSSVTTNVSFCSGPINIAIPEGNFPNPPAGAAASTVAVSGIPANAVVDGFTVTSNITHAYVGDVVMVIKAPNGQIYNLDALLNKTNNPGANFVNTIISPTGTTTLDAGTAPWTGTYKADAVGATFTAFGFTLSGGPLGYIPTTSNASLLYNTLGSANGNWTIAMYDAGAPDVGNLTSWCLNLTYHVGVITSAATWSPAAGLFSDSALLTPYIAGTQVDSVWTKPSTIGVNPYSVTVKSFGFDGFTTFQNPAPITIPSSGTGTPYPSPIVVSGLPTSGASVDNVVIRGLSHTWSNDIDIMLQSATGQNVILMSDVGGTGGLANVTYTFSDAGPAMNTGAPNATGTYHPTNFDDLSGADNWPAPGPGAFTQPAPALSLFGNTANVNGTWNLLVVDDVAGDQGNIANGWTITFKSPTVGCTSPPRIVNVTVNSPTVVANHPANQTICTDKVATFTVAATQTSTGPFTYTWQVSTTNGNPPWTTVNNGGVYSGATTATLTITAPPTTMSTYAYRCIITGAAPCAAATTNFAVLTVNPLPVIVIAPVSTRLYPGKTVTLTSTVSPAAAASGGYVWLRDGAVVQSSSLSTYLVTVDGLGKYRLRVTDVNGCTNISNEVTVSDSTTGRCYIYPNPTSGKFQVRYYSSADAVRLPRAITVYDAQGNKILTQTFPIGRAYQRMDIDLRNQGKGLYWVEVGDLNGNRLSMCRVVIQ